MLPRDPATLLSFINTKLRDSYADLDDLCDDLSADREELCRILAGIDYYYDAQLNRFV